MTALAGAQNLLQRLVDAIPTAWRQDPVFRGAAIGAGITGALLVLRAVGPHAPELQRGSSVLVPAAVPYVSAPGNTTAPPGQSPPAVVPKIAPGHPLGDVTIIPAPDSDRFGTFTPGKHP